MLGSKIETLLAVAEFQNFTKAAASLSLTQPAVIHHINQLEEELGVTLFIRGKGSLMLTPEGEILLKHIEPAMNLIKRWENQLLEAHTLNGGQLRIGASDTICRY